MSAPLDHQVGEGRKPTDEDVKVARKPKRPHAVIEAEAALAAKAVELQSAKEAVQRLEREHSELGAAVRKAREDADAALPQCSLVRVRWRGKEEDAGRHVILRQTPTGMLVTRRVGDPTGGYEWRFKWSEYSGKFFDAAKGGWTSDTLSLRDVPPEYMPAALAPSGSEQQHTQEKT